jgi:MIP family channel proteins
VAELQYVETHHMDDWVRPLIVEFIGPFTLVFAGAGAIMATAGGDIVAIAFAHGLAIALMIAAAGHISGGVYNPALTVGLMVTRRMDLPKGLAYIVVQVLGGVAAAAILYILFDEFQRNAVAFGVPQPGLSVSVGEAFLFEMVMTFFLMYAVFGNAVDSRSPKEIAALAIGLIITMDIFVGGAATGAAMNPARAFGPALVHNLWDDQWVYWLAPIAGAVVGALLFNYVLMGENWPFRGERRRE